jgi:hypothetical protein
MNTLNERYIVDADGNRVGVVLDMATWEHVVEELEDLEDIRDSEAALAALAAGDEAAIPFDQAMAEIDAQQQHQPAA